MSFTGQLGLPESQLGQIELGVVGGALTLQVPALTVTASAPAPSVHISASVTAPAATATASAWAPSVSLAVAAPRLTATGSIPTPVLVRAHVVPGVDVPTSLVLKARASGLTLFRASSLVLSEYSSSLGLMAPTQMEVYALSRNLALALHLSTLELEQPSTLVLEDRELELILDG